jgi:hypothetical protein
MFDYAVFLYLSQGARCSSARNIVLDTLLWLVLGLASGICVIESDPGLPWSSTFAYLWPYVCDVGLFQIDQSH